MSKAVVLKVCVVAVLAAFLLSAFVAVAQAPGQTAAKSTTGVVKVSSMPEERQLKSVRNVKPEPVSMPPPLMSKVMSREEMQVMATNTSVYVKKQGGTEAFLTPTIWNGTDLDQSPMVSRNESGYMWICYESYITPVNSWCPVMARALDTAGSNWNVTVLALQGARTPGFTILKNTTSGKSEYMLTLPQYPDKTKFTILNCSESKIWDLAFFGGQFDLPAIGLQGLTPVSTIYGGASGCWNGTALAALASVHVVNSDGSLSCVAFITDALGSGLNFNIVYTSPGSYQGSAWSDTIGKPILIKRSSAPGCVYFWIPVTYTNTTNPSVPDHDIQFFFGNQHTSNSLWAGYGFFDGTDYKDAWLTADNSDQQYWYYSSKKSGNYDIEVMVVKTYSNIDPAITVSNSGDAEEAPTVYAPASNPASQHCAFLKGKNIYYTHSSDSAATWSAPAQWNPVADTVSPTRYSFHVGSDGSDVPYVAWCDGRNAASTGSIVSVSPTPNAVNVPVTEPVEIIFDKAVDSASVKYSITSDPGLSASWTEGESKVSFDHSSNFNEGSKYTFTLTAANDVTGKTISGLPYSWSFDTEVAAAAVSISKPAANDKWPFNTVQDIVFSVSGGTAPFKAFINYSRDNGNSWNEITAAQNIDATAGSNTYSWTVPSPKSMQARVKVTVLDGLGKKGWADSNLFQITQGSASVSPVVEVLGPATGSVWYTGDQYAVNYTVSNGTAPFKVFVNYSADGTTWTPIGGSQPFTQAAAGAGSQMWTIPAVTPDPATSCKVKVEAVGGGLGTATSGAFTIKTHGGGPGTTPTVSVTGPTAGKVWYIGETYNINWTVSGGTTPYSVWVNYSTDGGTSFQSVGGTQPITQNAAGANTAAWQVPAVTGTAPFTNCVVRVDAVGGGRGTVDSAAFTINVHSNPSAPPSVTVTGPASGKVWYVGKTYSVNWTITNGATPYKIWVNYSTDGGTNYQSIGGTQPLTQASAGPGTTAWAIGSGVTASTNCKIKVEAVSSGKGSGLSPTFTVKVSGTKPGAPAGLSAKAGDARVELTWGAVSGADSYNIYRGDATGGPYVYLDMTDATNYNDTGVTNGQAYYYVVTALAGSLESDQSAEATATPQKASAGTGGDSGSMMMFAIVGIVVAVVVVVLIVLLLMMRKKKAAPAPPPQQYGGPMAPMPPPGYGQAPPPYQGHYGAPPADPYSAPPPGQAPPPYGAPPPQQGPYGAPPQGQQPPPPPPPY